MMTSFFEELKRRKVYRVAVAYVVAAGGVIQLASAVFPAWDLPTWALRLTVVLLLIGFPVALVLAWAFDVTPQGIQSTPSLPQAQAAASGAVRQHRRRNMILLVGSGIVISAVAGFFLLPHAGLGKVEKSIAVLPFENFSDKPDNAYFADGIQDDILTNLSKISDLKVISRTSVMGYRGKPKSVREIGKELGVSAILEGSVRRVGDRVRVNVQLIKVDNDEHLWAEDYDRELTDVFEIQTDLAKKIAWQLQARLSSSEQEQLTHKPTENSEAYNAYLAAHALQSFREDREKLEQAQKLYDRALELDPKFALAAANLSILHSWIFHNFEPTDGERELARRYAERAQTLKPELPEAHLARGFSLYYGDRDYESALREFGIAGRGLPNNWEIYLLIGAIQRRQARWDESTANLERAVSLNPKETWPLQNLFFNYQMQRDFKKANRVLDRALEIDPHSFPIWELKVKLAIAERGDLSVAHHALEKLRAQANNKTSDATPEPQNTELVAELRLGEARIAMYERRYNDALTSSARLINEGCAAVPHIGIEAYLVEGEAHEKLGQSEASRDAYLKAGELIKTMVQQTPKDAKRRALFGRVLAHLGEKQAAIEQAIEATKLLPESTDAFEGPSITTDLAEVYATTGENAKAIELLRGLLSRPSDLTPWLLKLDPIWDPLRNDPAFQDLLAKHDLRV
jgi:TolB-like protein/Flp pilus assembly protein TadD